VAAIVGLYGYYGTTANRRSLPSSPFDYAGRGSALLLIVHGDQDTLTSAKTARALAERARSASANPVVFVELPGAQHSFDQLSSIRFEAVIEGIEAFAASIAAPDLSRADRPNQLAHETGRPCTAPWVGTARSGRVTALGIGAERLRDQRAIATRVGKRAHHAR
jgi:fermentation-respiration switch protein FrsA (DUF1100 family)